MARLARLVAAAFMAVSASAADDAPPALSGNFDKAHNESLFWGPYKPNLYFGVRPRSSKGLWTGLMWSKIENFVDIQTGFRYTCEQGDDMHGYGWDEFDAREGGVQSIHDVGNKIDITTSFVKIPGGTHGGSWAARIKGVPREDAPDDMETLIYYYIAQDGDGMIATDVSMGGDHGFDGDVAFEGQSETLGTYKIVVTEGKGSHPSVKNEFSDTRQGDKTLVSSLRLHPELLWQGKPLVFQQLQESVVTMQTNIDQEHPPPAWQICQIQNQPGMGNAHIVQKTFQGAFEFDVIFSSGSAGAEVTSADVTKRIKEVGKSFGERFSSVINLKAPFTAAKYQTFAKSMLSNLLGGVGYFEGSQLIDRSYALEYDEEDEGFWEQAAEARARKAYELEGPYELISSVPSRPFFPRGFLWDEGFHLMLIADWDMDIALEIIQSWYNTMDDDGWIPREQILGEEARSKVPEEFQVQYPHYANPPTMFYVLDTFLDRMSSKKSGSSATSPYTAHQDDAELADRYLRAMYPRLRKQYDWFRKTQRGDIKSYDREAFSTKEAYRWKGRSETHVLTSGLDDYPRPQPPHPGELHVDLISWVGLMTKTLAKMAEKLDMPDEAAVLKTNLAGLRQNIHDLHWSDKEECFCDATIDEFEEHKLVCHKGYITLFPLLTGLLDRDDPKVGKLLDLIGSEDHLWSAHGVRSLSKQDPFYGTAEDYWRSPVWMPINYLIVEQLHDLATHSGPHKTKARKLYDDLRKNLVNTVYKSWEETGFAWEQYHPETGAGQRTKHFTGWTSLVTKIMAMDDLSGGQTKDEL